MRQFSLWPACRMRAFALALDTDLQARSIRAIGRADVVSHPVLGCAGSTAQYAFHDSTDPTAVPFRGARLARAIRAPAPPDMVVFAHVEARSAIPDDALCGVPCIIVGEAAARLSPSPLLMRRHGDEREGANLIGRAVLERAVEREVMSTVRSLLWLLGTTSPDELAWLSRPGLV